MPTYGMPPSDLALSHPPPSQFPVVCTYMCVCVLCSYIPLCVKMKNLVVTISCACVTVLWDTSRFSYCTWRHVWSRRRLNFVGEQHFQHPESSRRKWLQLQPTRWRICVTIVELCLIWNYVNVDVKDYVNVDDIMWTMLNYVWRMLNYMWCCNVFVNVS